MSIFADDLSATAALRKKFSRLYQCGFYRRAASGGAVKTGRDWRGMFDVIGFGANARTGANHAWTDRKCRGWRSGGADPATFWRGWRFRRSAPTCTDNQSRNRRFGMMLGRGMDVKVGAQDKIGQVAEG